MSVNDIREPIQKRSIEKKEKIIKCGFELICDKGYYNTNTAEIAKAANVSTGIVYQYFKDKHDILIEGIKRYANVIFYPMLDITYANKNINDSNIKEILREMINKFIENHKLSQSAHEEIMSMIHSDSQIANFFHKNEIFMTQKIVEILNDNGFTSENIFEKVHISINLIDDLCHEIVYHKHSEMNYDEMTNIVIDTIYNILKSTSK